jgi:hypothetical protein
MGQWWHNAFVAVAEWILLIGAVMTAIGIGFKRIYSMARGVEKIVEFTVNEKQVREDLATQLKKHIELVDQQHKAREIQIQELVSTVREISRETRPNGGSSMKDVLNHTAERVGEIQTRVAVLEEWKRHEERA